MVFQFTHGGYLFGAENQLSDDDCARIIQAIEKPGKGSSRVLGGRGVISETALSDGTQIIVKHFRRGGVLRFLIGRYYFGFRVKRPEVEYSILRRFRKVGGCAPEPVAFVTRGTGFYQGWMVTKKISGDCSLADLSLEDPDRASELLKDVVHQIDLLIKNRIFHVDLHPGNVLIDESGRSYIIDFDKAHIVSMSGNKLRNRYLLRWRRAVIKHNLPDFLAELLCGKLLKNYDGTDSDALYEEEGV